MRIAQVGQLAQRRLARGLKLNHPEAVGLIAAQMLESIRDGESVATLMTRGQQLLGRRQLLPGVASMIHEVQVEGTFPDGTKLLTVHSPVAAIDGARAPAGRPTGPTSLSRVAAARCVNACAIALVERVRPPADLSRAGGALRPRRDRSPRPLAATAACERAHPAGDMELALRGSFLPVPDLSVFGELAPEDAPPGAFLPAEDGIELNAGRRLIELSVMNTGDRPIQVCARCDAAGGAMRRGGWSERDGHVERCGGTRRGGTARSAALRRGAPRRCAGGTQLEG